MIQLPGMPSKVSTQQIRRISRSSAAQKNSMGWVVGLCGLSRICFCVAVYDVVFPGTRGERLYCYDFGVFTGPITAERDGYYEVSGLSLGAIGCGGHVLFGKTGFTSSLTPDIDDATREAVRLWLFTTPFAWGSGTCHT